MNRTLASLLCVAASMAVLNLACEGREGLHEPPTAQDGGQVDGGETPLDGGSDGGDDAGPTEYANLRIMTANLTSGEDPSYDLGHGIRLMEGMKPDVVLVQEFNYGRNGEDDIRRMVDRVGPGYHSVREDDALIANGIISRWPIIESGEWDDPLTATRDFVWARIDIPGPKDLWAVSVHLLTTDGDVRFKEATALIERMHVAVPMDGYLAIGGDLNTDTRGEPCFDVLRQLMVITAPYPADGRGNTNTSHPRSKPYDHVLVDPDLREYQQATTIGTNTFPAGLVLDSRVYSPLTDITPVVAGDSNAVNTQHMGVVKDFRIPVN